jgi:hypothetical protein
MKSDAGQRRASPEANGDISAVIRSCTAYPEPPWTLLAGNLLAKPSPVECRGIVHILTSEGFQGVVYL